MKTPLFTKVKFFAFRRHNEAECAYFESDHHDMSECGVFTG